MNFNCEKNAMRAMLSQVMKAVPSSSPIPILTNILLSAKGSTLEITSSDSTVRITASGQVDVIEEGSITCQAKLFESIISRMPNGEVINIQTVREGFLVVKSNSAILELPTQNSDEYPSATVPKSKDIYKVDCKAFASMVSMVALAAEGPNGSRAVLTGLLCELSPEGITMVATNTMRLAKMTSPLVNPPQDTISVIVKAKPLLDISGSLSRDGGEVEISISNKMFYLSVPGLSYSCSVIDGNFPDYKRVIPQKFQRHVQLSGNKLNDALTRVMIMAQDKDVPNLVRFKFEEDRLQLSAFTSNVGSGKEEIPIMLTGEALEIAFNGSYISEVIKSFDSDEVSFDFQDDFSSAILRPIGMDNYVYVCMPIRCRQQR